MFKSLLPWKHMKTNVLYVMAPEQTMENEATFEEQKLVPCGTCGRTFLALPLKKHAPICEKNASKKRKVFDSLKQRIEGTDLAQFHQKSYLKKPESTPKMAEKLKRPSRWEENHRKLVDAIRTAKESKDMSLSKKSQSVMPAATSPNERCPFCDRQFGPKAFDRHVEWCREHRTRIQKSPANVLLAKERLEARTKYKVPPLAKSKKITMKEKYSNPNTINRTESICSVKSTPPKRTPSVRKPKSVLDVGKKVETPSKIDKTNSTDEIKKCKVQNKTSRSRYRYCPPREKINSTHNENLESITVSPLKLANFPNKKITWKEISENTHDKNDKESVIVVYENSNVFKKKEFSKSESFIKELEDILCNEDETKRNSSSDTLFSEDNKRLISPKSKSSPEFISHEQPKFNMAMSTEEACANSQNGNSEVCTYPSTNFDEKLNVSSKSVEPSLTTCSGSLTFTEDVINVKLSSADLDDYIASSSNDLIFMNSDTDLMGSPTEEEEVPTDLSNTAIKNSKGSPTTSSYRFETAKENKENVKSDIIEDSFEDSENMSKNLDCSNSFFSFSSKVSSDESFLFSKFSAESGRKIECQIQKQSMGGDSNFRRFFNSVLKFGQSANHEYEVPKKRRKTYSGNYNFSSNNEKTETNELQHISQTVCLLSEIWKEPDITAENAKMWRRNQICLDRRLKMKKKRSSQIKKDISNVFLNYRSHASAPYNPFVSAERQLMELLECDDFKQLTKPLVHKQRPHTSVDESVKVHSKKLVKSAENVAKKRASVIDPPACFQDPDPDDFEFLENLINDQFNNDKFYLDQQVTDELDAFLSRRKYSDDVSSIDSNLINENDNLSIPEHFRRDNNYSPTSASDTDTTIQNDNVDLYNLQPDKQIESQTKGKVRKNSKAKTNSNSSEDAANIQIRTKNASSETVSNRKKIDAPFVKKKSQDSVNKIVEDTQEIIDLTVKAEDLFDVDDKMYAEYKIYEEMYLKEKEQGVNTKKQRTKNSIKSYGIEIVSDDHINRNKIPNDSAYGSLNRTTPVTRAAKPSSLERKRIDSMSSSGSDNFTNPPIFNNQRMSKFCHECGNKYPLQTAKFCVECGVKRLLL